jgi:thiosulfate reductase cytochrome b subunit
MSRNFYLYPVWVRLWHLTNAILCIFLIVTGLLIGIYDPSVDAADRYQSRVSIHNIAGILLTISYIGFFFGNLFTDNGKYYRARIRGSVKRMWRQVRYYVSGFSRGEEAPFPVDNENKFNPLQKASYIGAMYLAVPLIIISGWIMMYPGFLAKLPEGFNGYAFTDTLHIVLAIIISLFLVVHLVLSITGRNLRSIMSGWKESR